MNKRDSYIIVLTTFILCHIGLLLWFVASFKNYADIIYALRNSLTDPNYPYVILFFVASVLLALCALADVFCVFFVKKLSPIGVIYVALLAFAFTILLISVFNPKLGETSVLASSFATVLLFYIISYIAGVAVKYLAPNSKEERKVADLKVELERLRQEARVAELAKQVDQITKRLN